MRSSLVPLTLAVLLLAGGAARSVDIARNTSITIDEHQHIYGGYRFLVTGRTLNRPDVPDEHPPLGRLLLGLPLIGQGLRLPDESRDDAEAGGRFTTHFPSLEFVFGNVVPGPDIVLRARLANIALAVILGATVLALCWRRFGACPATAALAFLVACPNLAAHSAVATTDLPGATTFFLASIALAAFCARPTLPRAAVLGVALAAALLAKLTALALAPALALAALVSAFLPGAEPGGALGRLGARLPGPRPLAALAVRAAGLSVAGLTFVVALWAGFGFRDEPLGAAITAQESRPSERALLALRSAHLLPDPFWMALFVTVAHGAEAAHQSYFLGQTSYQGHPLYYPLAIALKTPLPTLLLALLGLALAARAARRAPPFLVLLAFPPLVLGAMLVRAHLNIGVRHALALYPFLFVLIAAAAARATGRWQVAALGLLALGTAGSALRSHPFELAYFNEAAGGTESGHRYLADSNLDWGQGHRALGRWLDAHDANGRVWLASFGLPVARAYGVAAEELPTPSRVTRGPSAPLFDPGSGPAWLAVSVNEMLGLYRDSPSPWRELLERQPIARVGGSIWLYDATGDAHLRARIGDAWREGRDPERARAHYQGALALDPAEPLARAGLVHLAIGAGDTALARRLLADAPAESPPLRVAEARLALAAGEVGRALAALERGTALDPASYDAHLLLAVTVLARGGDLGRGEAAARRASELAPGVATAWDLRASYRARAGDLTEAARLEREALRRVRAGSRADEYRRRLESYETDAASGR